MKEVSTVTDVLVVGGGMAGSFAAIRARQQGADVVVVDKGHVSRSGSTPYPKNMMVFDPGARGHDLERWMGEVALTGEYLNDRAWTEVVLRESRQVFDQLVSWGVGFRKDADGRILRNWGVSGGIESVQLEADSLAPTLRGQLLRHGISIVERVMLTELIVADNRVLGAVGVSTINEVVHVFTAKAVVLCTGASSFKPYGFPLGSVTGDGVAMAYRAGVEITGKEFYDTHATSARHPADVRYLSMERPSGQMPPLGLRTAEGETIELPGPTTLLPEFEAHAGRAPLTPVGPGPGAPSPCDAGPGPDAMVGGAGLGYGGVGEGIWPADGHCGSSLPGLFSAGEACGTRVVGARYPGGGWGVPSAGVTGDRAGRGAAAWAVGAETEPIDGGIVAALTASALAPLRRNGGFGPDWVTQMLRNTVAPYYVLGIGKGDRLEAVLTLVGFMRDHLVPRLMARDAHELRKAHETRNMVLNAEMKLRAALFRTESRGTHYREDFPARSDPDWLAWVVLADRDGHMTPARREIPRDWWPDLALPYGSRYPLAFPGEDRPDETRQPLGAPAQGDDDGRQGGVAGGD